MRTSSKVMGLLLAMVMVGAACGSDSNNETEARGSTTSSTSSGECTPANAGGALTVGTFTAARGLDPTATPGGGTSGGSELAALYDTLMRFDPATGEHEPRVAESLESDESRTAWTLRLRDGVMFGNGDPLTTADVAFTIDRHRSPESASNLRAVASVISEMEVVDDLTMVFHLRESWGNFPTLLAGPAGMIVSKSGFESLGEEGIAADPAGAGVGPYEVARNASGEELILRAKDSYWGGPVCIQTIKFVNVASASGTYEAFRNGELDVAVLRNSETIAEAREDATNVAATLVSGGRYWMMNNGARGSTPPTMDVRVRKAFAHAIDPEVLNQRMVGGTGVTTTALLHEQSLLYSGAEGVAYDPERAAELVEEVKAEGEWDGSLVLTCTATPEGEELTIATEALLEVAGFDVEVEFLARNDMIQKVAVNADYSAVCWSLNVYDSSPWSVLVRNVSGGDSPGSYVGYSDPDMDAALKDLQTADDLDSRKAAMAEIQEVWNETMPGYTSFSIEEAIIWSDDVGGLDLTQESIVFYDKAFRTK